jgi:hypothetical protein
VTAEIGEYKCQWGDDNIRLVLRFVVKRRGHNLVHVSVYHDPHAKQSYLGQHASPGDDVCIDWLACLLFMACDGLEEAIQVLVDPVVMLDELVVGAIGQVGAEIWRVVPFQGGVVLVKFMVLVIGEACKLLYPHVSCYLHH